MLSLVSFLWFFVNIGDQYLSIGQRNPEKQSILSLQLTKLNTQSTLQRMQGMVLRLVFFPEIRNHWKTNNKKN